MRDASQEEQRWLLSLQRILDRRPAGTFLFAEGGGTLNLHDLSAWKSHEGDSENPASLPPLGSARCGKNFDAGGY